MSSTRSAYKVRRGDPVYDEERKPKQANGKIKDIDWREKTVVVEFYDGDEEEIDFDRFQYAWSDAFGGMWWLT